MGTLSPAGTRRGCKKAGAWNSPSRIPFTYSNAVKRSVDTVGVVGSVGIVSFNGTEFQQVLSKGDGYCIVHSVLTCLDRSGMFITKEDVLRNMKATFESSIDDYVGFVSEEMSPIEELEAYVAGGSYNSNMGDFVLQIISKMLGIKINVLVKPSNGKEMTLSCSIGSGEREIFVEKVGAHYDALTHLNTNQCHMAKGSYCDISNKSSDIGNVEKSDPVHSSKARIPLECLKSDQESSQLIASRDADSTANNSIEGLNHDSFMKRTGEQVKRSQRKMGKRQMSY